MPTYYLSSTGDDANDGLSELKPWQTLDKLSNFPMRPGDVFRLQGGATFAGFLRWFFRDLGDPANPITISSYGTGRPTVASPKNIQGLLYAGLGGITVEGINFAGDCSVFGTSGLRFAGTEEPVKNLRLLDLNVRGYSLGGIEIDRAIGVEIVGCRLHHNANGTHLFGIDSLSILDTEAADNDRPGGNPQTDVGGYGFAVYNSQNLHLERCRAVRNGMLTTPIGGHGGIILQDCDHGVLVECRAVGNGDPTDNDGHGVIFYGSKDCRAKQCVTSGNRIGYGLFADSFSRTVERCVLCDCHSFGDVLVGMEIQGEVMDSTVCLNRIHDTGYKAFNVDNTDRPPNRGVRVWGNEFHSEELMLEAANGLEGVLELEANRWLGAVPVFRVRGKDYSSIATVLAAEPLIP